MLMITNNGEPVSNFTIKILGTVQVDRDAGGPGFIANLKRIPDGLEKYVCLNCHTCIVA